MNIALTILQKKVEDLLNVAVFGLLVEGFELRHSPIGLPRSLDVAADLAESPESQDDAHRAAGKSQGWSPDRRYRDYRHAMSSGAGSLRRCCFDRAVVRQFVFRYEFRDCCYKRSNNDDTARWWKPIGAT
jgi:hypothetical protein